MSLYNLLFGMNPNADQLLSLVGLKRDDVQRFRDAYVNEDGLLCVYSRTGGNNREHYVNATMRSLPCWISSEDDDFDNTYATDLLRLPDNADALIAALNTEQQP